MLTGWLVCDAGPCDLFIAIHIFRKWRRRIQRKHTAGALMKGSGVRVRLDAQAWGNVPLVLAEWHKGDKSTLYDAPPRVARRAHATNAARAKARQL
jgi:hypothetical protein